MGIRFTKMTGAGNDFLLLDNRDLGLLPDTEERRRFIARVAARGTGVGADGVLFVEPSEGHDFRMRYYNADGGEAESCGNGARCVARFAREIGAAGPEMEFETMAGPYRASVLENGEVRVSMGDPRGPRWDVEVVVPGLFHGSVDYVDTGVPHVVLFVEDLDAAPVLELGRALRFHEAFAPAGANVNFAAPAGRPDAALAMRTYERGVEGETLACGTGALAVALCARPRLGLEPPLGILSRAGLVLRVDYEPLDERGGRGMQLEGEARMVYHGELAEWE